MKNEGAGGGSQRWGRDAVALRLPPQQRGRDHVERRDRLPPHRVDLPEPHGRAAGHRSDFRPARLHRLPVPAAGVEPRFDFGLVLEGGGRVERLHDHGRILPQQHIEVGFERSFVAYVEGKLMKSAKGQTPRRGGLPAKGQTPPANSGPPQTEGEELPTDALKMLADFLQSVLLFSHSPYGHF